MECVDFYNDYISDLSKIKYVVSKEDDTILTGKVFTDNIDVDGNEDIYNLNTKNDDDAFLIACIGLQWYVFIDFMDRELVKPVKH